MSVLLNIVFGDVSGDGHSQTDKFTVVVEGDFSEQMLADNFDRNAIFFGYEPGLFAAEYEESTVDPTFLAKLLQAGMSTALPGLKPWERWFTLGSSGTSLPEDVPAAIAILEDEDEDVALTTDGYLQIVMFLMGYNLTGFGLEGFSWHEQKPKSFFSLTKTVGYRNVGYGLFY